MAATRKRGVQKKGTDMKTSIKLGVAAATGMLGVSLATSGAFAATGPLTARHAPGRALQGSAVVRAMGQRVTTAMPTATSTTAPTMMPTATSTAGTTTTPTAMPTATSTSRTTMTPTAMPTATSASGTTMMPTATSTTG